MSINGIAVTGEQLHKKTQNHKIQIERLSDSEIQKLATTAPKKRLQDVKRKSFYTLILGIPLVDSTLNAAMTSGKLYTKASAFVKNNVKWAGIFAVGAGVLGIKNDINKNIQPLNNFDKKHPAISFGIDVAALFTAYNFAGKGANALKNLAIRKYPKIFHKISNKIEKPLKLVLNHCKINNNIRTFDKHLTKNPYAKTAGTILLTTAAPLMAISTLVRQNKEINAAINQANKNYVILKAFNSLLPEKTQEQDS